MDNKVFLTQTDTTIGFISKSSKALDIIKHRKPNKNYITAIPSLKTIKKRVPKIHKRAIRRANKSTFIVTKDYSFRVIKDKKHLKLIIRLNSAYTTSANKSGFNFDIDFAFDKADIIIYPLIRDKKPSKLFKLGKTKMKKLR